MHVSAVVGFQLNFNTLAKATIMGLLQALINCCDQITEFVAAKFRTPATFSFPKAIGDRPTMPTIAHACFAAFAHRSR